MSGKRKNFPLPLSSVMGKAQPRRLIDSDYRLREIAPQTAVRNMADNRMVSAQETKTALRPKATQLPQVLMQPKNMAAPIRGAIAMAEKIAAQGVRDKMVLSALATVPRHFFVESGLSQQAYADTSLPIGHQQTISRPYTVARMIEAVRMEADGKKLSSVLEIGTGCGYQAAILSQVSQMVYSIERIKALHELAKKNLRHLRIPNLRLHYGDGMLGLPQVAPFDAIVIAAAGLEVPEALFGQLAVGGYMIAPIGNEKQTLQLTKRTGERQWQSVMLEDCHFVPLRQGVI